MMRALQDLAFSEYLLFLYNAREYQNTHTTHIDTNTHTYTLNTEHTKHTAAFVHFPEHWKKHNIIF